MIKYILFPLGNYEYNYNFTKCVCNQGVQLIMHNLISHMKQKEIVRNLEHEILSATHLKECDQITFRSIERKTLRSDENPYFSHHLCLQNHNRPNRWYVCKIWVKKYELLQNCVYKIILQCTSEWQRVMRPWPSRITNYFIQYLKYAQTWTP